jgi:large subunit ribosomal protein L5
MRMWINGSINMEGLKKYYIDTVVPRLAKEKFAGNPMMVPRIEKIVINMGLADAITDSKVIDKVMDQLQKIAGQRPVITKARKSLAAFKLREGMSIGCKVTLRKERMYWFLDKLITVHLPRLRDFRGFSSNSFDKNGNFNFGLKSQAIFLEIDYDSIDKVRGMDIAIITSAKNDEDCKALLQELYFPFRN